MKYYIREARPQNWLKNIFIFVPLVFSLKFFYVEKLLTTIFAVAVFCLVSSAIYVFNDIFDRKADAAHPIKCSRPIASGALPVGKAAVFGAILAVIGVAAGFALNLCLGVFTVLYLALNMAYTRWLKLLPVLDCFCIAASFVLRVYAGGAASGESVSDWLFLTVVSMALFMAFGKRRGELLRIDETAARPVLQRYDLQFLNGILFVCAGLSIAFYALWAMNRGFHMIYTVPLIIFIVAKYLLLIHNPDSHGDPTTVILQDKVLLCACGVYGLTVIGLLYFGGTK